MSKKPYTEGDRENKRRYYLENKERILAANAAWRANNPERCKAISLRYDAEHREDKAKRTAQSDAKHREARLARLRESHQIDSTQLTDRYVKRLFVHETPLSVFDVPDEIVPMLRARLQIKRHLRGITA